MPAKKTSKTAAISEVAIANAIALVRGHRVMLDSNLAALYGVETRVLVQAVKRNLDRFPEDFMFQLSWDEAQDLRSQSVILDSAPSRSQTVSLKRGSNIKYRPYAFTEQGVAMLSSVLRSPSAIAVNIGIMRAFMRMREILATNKELAAKLAQLERKLDTHDQAIAGILDAIRSLMAPPPQNKRSIGFISHEEKKR